MPLNGNMFTRFFRRTLITPLLDFLKQGLSPEKLALSVACGVVLSTFPVIGSTTILCTVASFAFGLNLPATQLVNYFAFPLQLILLPAFIRIGEFIFREAPISLSAFQIISMIKNNTLEAINTLWWATMHAIVAWLFVGPLAVYIIYRTLTPIFTRLAPFEK